MSPPRYSPDTNTRSLQDTITTVPVEDSTTVLVKSTATYQTLATSVVSCPDCTAGSQCGMYSATSTETYICGAKTVSEFSLIFPTVNSKRFSLQCRTRGVFFGTGGSNVVQVDTTNACLKICASLPRCNRFNFDGRNGACTTYNDANGEIDSPDLQSVVGGYAGTCYMFERASQYIRYTIEKLFDEPTLTMVVALCVS